MRQSISSFDKFCLFSTVLINYFLRISALFKKIFIGTKHTASNFPFIIILDTLRSFFSMRLYISKILFYFAFHSDENELCHLFTLSLVPERLSSRRRTQFQTLIGNNGVRRLPLLTENSGLRTFKISDNR